MGRRRAPHLRVQYQPDGGRPTQATELFSSKLEIFQGNVTFVSMRFTRLLLLGRLSRGTDAVVCPAGPVRAPFAHAALLPEGRRCGSSPPLALARPPPPRLPARGGPKPGAAPRRGSSSASGRAGADKGAARQIDHPLGTSAQWASQREAFFRSFLPALALFLCVRTFLVEPFFIPSLSMVPTLTPNDQIAVDKFSKLWVRAFAAPPNPPHSVSQKSLQSATRVYL